MAKHTTQESTITLQVGHVELQGILNVPAQARGIILFAHGSGSSHRSPRNQLVAKFFQEEGFATLLFDLLTLEEEKKDLMTRELRFNIPFLTSRLQGATRWVEKQEKIGQLPVGYFGASTGAAAAIQAASDLRDKIGAVVSRGGRPDLAGQSLIRLKVPTLLIVGSADYGVIELNEKAFSMLSCVKKFEIIPDATHLFEEPGALEEVGRIAKAWFTEFL